MKPIQGLGPLQAEVMELIWQQKESTVAAIVEAIARRRPVTYTTVLSAVQKLEKKGWLKHRSEGRAHVYFPTEQREQVGARTLRELLKNAFRGDPRLLLASLLDETQLGPAELQELRQLIEKRRKEIRNE